MPFTPESSSIKVPGEESEGEEHTTSVQIDCVLLGIPIINTIEIINIPIVVAWNLNLCMMHLQIKLIIKISPAIGSCE
jgi:hypothetical protein